MKAAYNAKHTNNSANKCPIKLSYGKMLYAMKPVFICLCLFLASKAFSQVACFNTKIETPVISKPTEASIISTTCSTLVVKWKGGTDTELRHQCNVQRPCNKPANTH